MPGTYTVRLFLFGSTSGAIPGQRFAVCKLWFATSVEKNRLEGTLAQAYVYATEEKLAKRVRGYHVVFGEN